MIFGARCSELLQGVLLGALAASLPGGASPANAAPQICPLDSGDVCSSPLRVNTKLCSVSDGGATLALCAGSQDDELEVIVWSTEGVSDLSWEAPFLFDLIPPHDPVTFDLVSAIQDPATGTIVAIFTEASAGLLTITETFDLNETPGGSEILETAVLNPRVPGLSGRFFILTDFDLNEDSTNDSAVITGGNTLTQTETDMRPIQMASVTGTVEVLSPVPDAFQVATFGVMSIPLYSNVLITLDGTATVPGPADFEAAFSWDETLTVGSPTVISLKKTIAVPEPAAALLRVSVLVALAALALRRRARGPQLRGWGR